MPDYASPPGDTLADLLDEGGITIRELAERIGATVTMVNDVVAGKAAITMAMAVQLERVLQTPADFWIRREAVYRADLARLEKESVLAKESAWLKTLPVRSMRKLGWVCADFGTGRIVRECLQFFGVESVSAWAAKYEPMVDTRFRASKKGNTSLGAVAAWLRKGEIDAESLECGVFDREKLVTSLAKLRELTLLTSPKQFVPLVQDTCAACGVAVVFVPTPRGCPAHGATRWLGGDKPVVQLSLRYKSNDQLWFTFFHELGHILLHDRRVGFFELDERSTSALELEANTFAQDQLIPKQMTAKLRQAARSMEHVKSLARELGIAPGIVVGRLQHDGLLPWSSMSELKVFYSWDELGVVLD